MLQVGATGIGGGEGGEEEDSTNHGTPDLIQATLRE
jgi:hypothetical protein